MADDKHFVMGDYYRICERTGFKIRAGRTRKEWTNRIVRDKSFEMRQPQDFVQGVRDDQTVYEPRPRSVDSFQGPLGTTTTADILPYAEGPWIVQVASSVRMFIDDVVNVMQDDGTMLRAVLMDIPTATSVRLDRSPTAKVSNGNILINLSAESDPVLYM